MSTNLIPTPPQGPTEQHITVGGATFITYKLFLSNVRYRNGTVKLGILSQLQNDMENERRKPMLLIEARRSVRPGTTEGMPPS